MENGMQDLIARLEAAEVGGRELDVAIWAKFQSLKVKVIDFWSVYGDEQKTAVGFSLPPKRTRVTTNKFGGFSHAEPVTTSLDAALALAERVLPGWGWCMRTDETGQCFANVYPGSPNIDRIFYDAYAATHPIALCIAILRAKMETEK